MTFWANDPIILDTQLNERGQKYLKYDDRIIVIIS